MTYLIRWDVVAHGGDQLSMRVLAREFFTDRCLTQNIIYYFFDWRPFGYPEDNYTPLHILTWAILIKLTGGWENSFLLFNALVWSSQVFLWSDISQRLVGSRVPGWLTFGLFSFAFGVPTCVTTGLKEPLALLFLLLFIRRCLDPEGQHRWLKAGAFLGLSYLCRYNAQMVLPLGLVFATTLWQPCSWRQRLQQAGALGLGFAAIALPWWIRNFLALGNPFEYLVTKYPFSTHWTGYFVQRYFWEYPPTPENLYAHYGFSFVWDKVLADWRGNLSVFLDLSSFHWGLCFVGLGLVVWRTGFSGPVRGITLVFLLALSQVPAAFMATLARYHLLSFIFLFFAAALIVTHLFDLLPSPPHRGPASGVRREWVLVGLGICVLSIAVDWLGVGESGFGLAQTLLLICGLAVVAGGLLIPVRFFPRHSRQVALAVAIMPLLLSPVRQIEAGVRAALRDKEDPAFVLHRRLGEELRRISRPEDVVMMSFPAIAHYYSGLRAVQAPIDIMDPVSQGQYRSLERDKLDRVIRHYGVTLFADYQARDVARVLADTLVPVSRVEGFGEVEGVTIYRLGAQHAIPEAPIPSAGP